MLKSIGTQLEQSEKGSKNYVNKMLEGSEANLRNEIEQLNKRIGEMRMENHKYAFELQKSANELNIEHDKMLNLKKETLNSLDTSVMKMENMHKDTTKELDEYKSEFNKIKSRFVELSEFIKDIRFKRNAGIVDMDKKELKHFANRMAFQDVAPRQEKRHSTIIAKYPTINDLDRAVDTTDYDDKAKTYFDSNTQRIDMFAKTQRQDGVIVETEDNEETLPGEEKTKSGVDFYGVETKRREFESERLSSKVKSKLADSSRRHDTSQTKEKDSPLRGNHDVNHFSPNKKSQSDVDKRTYELEKRIIEIEHNAKKKLEELTAQLKLYIPSINFNPYVKRTDKNDKLPQVGQVNVENLIYNNNTGQNFALNMVDSTNIINNAVLSATAPKKFIPIQKPGSNIQTNHNGVHTQREYYSNNNVLQHKQEQRSTSKTVK
jgi:hypothetical protein